MSNQQHPQQPGQQVPQHQPLPQGGQGFPHGQCPQHAPWQGEPQPKPKRSLGGKIKLGVYVVLAAIGFGFGINHLVDEAKLDEALTVGECVTVSGETNDPEIEAAPCDRDASESIVLRVLEDHEGSATCEDPMVTYSETKSGRRNANTRTTKTVCLAEVLEEGQCYEPNDTLAGLNTTDCGSTTAEFKVTRLADDAAAECASGEQAFRYPVWPRTYCLAPPA